MNRQQLFQLRSVWLAAFALSLPGFSVGQQCARAQATTRSLVLGDCMVSAPDEVEIPARQAGVLLTLSAREGASVEAGQKLGQIDASQQLLKRELAEIERQAAEEKAAEDIDVRFSRAAAAVSETEYQQALSANERLKNTIPMPEVRRLQLSAHKTRLQIEKAEAERRAASLVLATRQAEHALATDNVARCDIISPLAGDIVEVLRRPGEWVQPGEGIARVVRLDVLRVEGFVNALERHPSTIDRQPVRVVAPQPGGGMTEFTGQIVFVSPVVQAGKQYRVWAEVQNRRTGAHWELRPGMMAEMRIEFD